jgi:hypothetical protein
VPLKIRGRIKDVELQRCEIKKIRARLLHPTCELYPSNESECRVSVDDTSSSEILHNPSVQRDSSARIRLFERPPIPPRFSSRCVAKRPSIPPRSTSLQYNQHQSDTVRPSEDMHTVSAGWGVNIWSSQMPTSQQPAPPSPKSTGENRISYRFSQFPNTDIEAAMNSNNVLMSSPSPLTGVGDHRNRSKDSLLLLPASPTRSASVASSIIGDEGFVPTTAARHRRYAPSHYPSGGLSVQRNYQVVADMISAYGGSWSPDYPLSWVPRRRASLWRLR